MEVKALACELPCQRQLPFSRLSHADIAKEAVERGIVASVSGATVWRWLSADAIKPWTYRSWISPRDPQFPQKAGRVLDLYHGLWQQRPLGADDYVICADEKPSIQALPRPAPTTAPTAHRPGHLEFQYRRRGTLAYLA
ncbi:MAG: IS630 family transposase, partial [Terriglobia bacterium]